MWVCEWVKEKVKGLGVYDEMDWTGSGWEHPREVSRGRPSILCKPGATEGG